MANYANKFDIAMRLLYAKPHWLHGKPTISIKGTEGKFGTLSFDFKDEVVHFKIYIRGRQSILDEAELAVKNFNKIIGKLHEQ